MNTNFRSLFNIEKPQDSSQESSLPPEINYSFFEKEDIYENPNCLNIKSNISRKTFRMLIDFYDMGFIASIAENLFVLPAPVKNLYGHNRKYAAEKFESDQKTSKVNLEKNIRASKKLDKKVSYRETIFESISKVYPDFCKNMESKIGKEKYSLYHSTRNALRTQFSRDPRFSETDPLFSDILLTFKDNLSALIDSPKFSEACNIEDQFVISELDTFMQILANMPKEEQKPFHRKRLKIGEDHFSTFEIAEKLKAERISRLQKYAEIQKLYEKLNNHSYIKLELHKKDSEDCR